MSHLLFFRTGCCTYIVNVGKHFASGRVPDAKYISGCKCGICTPKAYKLCAQQTAKNWRKAPKGIFDTLGRIRKDASFFRM